VFKAYIGNIRNARILSVGVSARTKRVASKTKKITAEKTGSPTMFLVNKSVILSKKPIITEHP
jgi:hypothetical protein